MGFRPCIGACAAATLLVLAGCGTDERGPDGSASATTGAGGSGSDCGPGALLVDGGGCLLAGVPPESCGEGFFGDDGGGCVAELPAEPCGGGTMALPGESACRAVAPCGEGTWGDIPIDADTQFVDASYAGSDSDGTQQRPWTRVSEGIAAALPGSIVALAAGTYLEDFQIAGATGAVRLWGRCPELVELKGEGVKLGTAWIRDGAHGTEIRDLAITGPRGGVFVTDAMDVLLERVWIHDTGERGLHVEDYEGPASATLRGSLVEYARRFGVIVMAESAIIEGSVIRDVTPYPDADPLGRGIQVEDHPDHGRSSAVVRRSLVERVAEIGVSSVGSDLTVEDTLIRDIALGEDGLQGRGLDAEDDGLTGAEQTLAMRRSVVTGARQFGLFMAGVTGTIEHTTVSWTLPDGDGKFGRGAAVQMDPDTGRRSDLVVRASLFAHSTDVGLAIHGSTVVLEAVAVRDTAPAVASQSWGYGIAVQPDAGELGDMHLLGCRVERSHMFGVAVLGSNARIEGTLVSETSPRHDGVFGDGLAVRVLHGSPAAVTVSSSRVERSARAGIAAFGASVSLADTVLDCNAIDLDREFADAVEATFDDHGGVICGCDGVLRECQVSQAELAPPDPPAPSE